MDIAFGVLWVHKMGLASLCIGFLFIRRGFWRIRLVLLDVEGIVSGRVDVFSGYLDSLTRIIYFILPKEEEMLLGD